MKDMNNQKRISNEIRRIHEYDLGLIAALELVEKENGYIPLEYISMISAEFGISKDMIMSVIRNLDRFHERPQVGYLINICNGAVCNNMAAFRLVKACLEFFNIEETEITTSDRVVSEDGRFEIQLTGCIGACGKGPVIMINDELYTEITPQKLKNILLDII